MRTYMAKLGGFQFGIDTAAFQELQRTSSYRWEAKNRIGRKPAQQNIGQGADTITLSGVIYPHWRGGIAQLARLRSQAGQGEPLPFVYGFESAGQYCGLYCVTDIEETRTVFFDNGAPRKIEFNLKLVEYGDDAGAAQLSPVVGFSLATTDIAGTVANASAVATQAAAATNQADGLSLLNTTVASARSVASTVATTVKQITSSDAVRLVRGSITAFRSVQNTTALIQTAATRLSAAGSNPAQAFSALNSMASAANSATSALNGVSAGLLTKVDANNGGSTDTAFNRQMTAAAGIARDLAGATAALQNTANSLKVLM